MWETMETAPKDRPILVMCSDKCDDPHCVFNDHCIGPDVKRDGRQYDLCLYHAHTEGLSAYGDGPAIVQWGGAWDDRTWEYDGGWMPDWWFVYKSEFEVAANPVLWYNVDLGPLED